jgi:hypothetical protein
MVVVFVLSGDEQNWRDHAKGTNGWDWGALVMPNVLQPYPIDIVAAAGPFHVLPSMTSDGGVCESGLLVLVLCKMAAARSAKFWSNVSDIGGSCPTLARYYFLFYILTTYSEMVFPIYHVFRSRSLREGQGVRQSVTPAARSMRKRQTRKWTILLCGNRPVPDR